jgi:hypothetical protein
MWRLLVVIVLVLRRLGMVESGRTFKATTQRLLREAESIEVLSLGGADTGSGPFHNALILGRAVVSSRKLQRRLTKRLLMANRYNMGGSLCLGAEYGLRVQSRDTTLELTFCFDCSQVWVVGPNGYRDGGCTAAFAARPLIEVLTQAGVPLPPPRTH